MSHADDSHWRTAAIWRMAVRKNLPDDWVEARLVEHLGKRGGDALSKIWLRRPAVFLRPEDKALHDLAADRTEAERYVSYRRPSPLDLARAAWVREVSLDQSDPAPGF